MSTGAGLPISLAPTASASVSSGMAAASSTVRLSSAPGAVSFLVCVHSGAVRTNGAPIGWLVLPVVHVRRNLEILERELHDVGERGRGDDPAPDRATRLVDGDKHDELGTLRRCEADERRDVARVGVPTGRLGFRSGSGLPGDAITRDLSRRPRALLDDPAKHLGQLVGRPLGEHASLLRIDAPASLDSIDEVWL